MKDNDYKITELDAAPIPRLILKYFSASFFALFFDALYNIIDTLFIGRGVGDNAMGGVSVAFPFMLIQGAIAQTVGGGAAAAVSRLIGKNDREGAGSVTANAMAVFYISAVIVTVLGLSFMTPVLRLCGATDDILPYAEEYFTVILLGNVFSTGFSSIIRAEGAMGYSLLIWLIPTGVNITLDAVFIYALHMGVKGAALATIICQMTSFAMSVAFFTRRTCQSFKKVKLSAKTAVDIIAAGFPTLVQTGGLSLLFAFINKILSVTDGAAAVNTFAYLSKLITFAVVPINAMSQAASPVIGYGFGKGNFRRAENAYRFSVAVCLIYSGIAAAAALLLPDRLMSVFSENAEIVALGAQALKILSAALPFAVAVIITASYFQAGGKKLCAAVSGASLPVLIIILSLPLS